MGIPYASRSRFLDACEQAIRRGRAQLDASNLVEVMFEDGGYPGVVTVDIRADDSATFGSDWEANDPTRFPARIKAAATALFACGCRGRFLIEHGDGRLTIRAA